MPIMIIIFYNHKLVISWFSSSSAGFSVKQGVIHARTLMFIGMGRYTSSSMFFFYYFSMVLS